MRKRLKDDLADWEPEFTGREYTFLLPTGEELIEDSSNEDSANDDLADWEPEFIKGREREYTLEEILLLTGEEAFD